MQLPSSAAIVACVLTAGCAANEAARPADDLDASSAADGASPDAGDVDGAAPDGGSIAFVAIPAGEFVMGDHIGNGGKDPRHPSDELPLHAVTLRAFAIARTETTCEQFVPFLEDAAAKGRIGVQNGVVVDSASGAALCDTAGVPAANCVTWDGQRFGIVAGRERHPASGVRWAGAAAYCNWYGARLGLDPCYDLATGTTDWNATCVRLPTEAEWEYAARGGVAAPYADYPWGDTRDDARVNWVGSNDPWEEGPQPLTTPVGFFDGSLRRRADFDWPSPVESYQTLDGSNGYGLYDMAGNVWEWVNDWYGNAYYSTSPGADPPGPETGSPMPDGSAYHVLRGGSFFNATVYRGDHERVSNRDPAYFRGKYLGVDDPDGPWFHIGFRVARQER